MTRFPRGPLSARSAALVLIALLVVFFWTAIARFGDAYYSSADISRASSFTSVGDRAAPSNQLLSDPVVQMEPWRRLARDEIAAGRLPLWNPWNAGGMPLFANLQSALLSPFTLPHYFLPERAALLVAAFLELFCAGFMTYMVLRKLGLGSAAALLGGVVYAFAGHNVLLLAYPHSGVSALVPVALLCVETARERFLASRRFDRGVVLRLALLALAIAACVFAGHPEACIFALVFIAAHAMWRAFTLGLGRSESVKLLAGFALGAIAGIALAAIQLVPFAEYVGQSRAWADRGGGSMPIWSSVWSLGFFPDLGGNPSTSYRIAEGIPPPNYETANLVYVGSIALFLVLVALGSWRRRREMRFFAIVLVVWFLCAYDVGFGRSVARLPLVSALPINRSQLVEQISIACLAAFALDDLVSSPRSMRRAMGWALTGTALLFAFLTKARIDFEWLLATYPAARAMIQSHVPGHVALVVASYALGVIAVCTASLSSSRGVRAVCAGVLVLAAFTQTGWLWRAYNPVCDERFFHPRTPAIDELARIAGDDPFVIVGADTIPPSENSLHGLRMISGYDALWNARYDRLACAAFGDEGNWRLTRRAEAADLVRFGVRCVLARSVWPPIGTFFGDLFEPGPAEYDTDEITGESPVEQQIELDEDTIDALLVRFRGADRAKSCRVGIQIVDASNGTELAVDEFAARDLVPDGRASVRVMKLAAPFRVHDRSLAVRVSSPEAHAGDAVALRARRDLARWIDDVSKQRARRGHGTVTSSPASASWHLTQAGHTLEGGLELDVSNAWKQLEPVGEIASFRVLRLAHAPGRFRCVARVVAASSEAEAAEAALDSTLDPRETVVLEGTDAPSIAARLVGGDLAFDIQRLSESPTRIELTVESDRAALLVTALAWYPGWSVEVNGVREPLLRVDSAFQAVAVPAGKSRVVFAYVPHSLIVGALVSAAALLAFAMWIAAASRITPLQS